MDTKALKESILSIEEGKKVIIAIGASAGGLEALQDFLSHLPAKLDNASILIAQHLSPTHKSMLVQLLSRETKLTVIEAVEGVNISPNTVYITPPDKDILVSKNNILLRRPINATGPKPSVDVFFTSLADLENASVFAIILSGTGTDGAVGVKAVKQSGGMVIVQDPNTAKYNGMPVSAIETGCVDIILKPHDMGQEIYELLLNPDKRNEISVADTIEEEGGSIDKIFKLLSKRSGTDFSNYKPSTIYRRIDKRLEALQINSLENYLSYIHKNPKELDILFNIILIGVTSFFRDDEAFEALTLQLKKLLSEKKSESSIRFWIVGCATGEEAYSLAILLSELFNGNINLHRVQIFATDINDAALNFARKGIYDKTVIESLPASILEKYFIKHPDCKYEVIKTIRNLVLFSKHDITTNPPFLKIDLISCRNLLIYFGSLLQKHIIPVFHYALNENGYLFLGKSETIGIYNDLFTTIDSKNKIYIRKIGASLHAIKFSNFRSPRYLKEHIPESLENKESLRDQIKETLFETLDLPFVVVNDTSDIIEVKGDIRLFISLKEGALNVNLFKMLNPELQIDVRNAFNNSVKLNKTEKTRLRKISYFGTEYFVIVYSKPVIQKNSLSKNYIILFELIDLPELINIPIIDESAAANIRIRELDLELTATKEYLQTYIEELETSNEELQSLNEELQSTNEELQSTNEELETGSEELQSSNEELQIAYTELKTANEQLEQKDKILKEERAHQSALLNNTLWGCLLVDTNYCLLLNNKKAEEQFKQLHNIKIKPGDSLNALIGTNELEWFISGFNAALNGDSVVFENKLVGKSGNEYWFKFDFNPVISDTEGLKSIAIGMLDTTELKLANKKMETSEKIMSSVFNVSNTGICITDSKGYFIRVNKSYCEIYGYTREEMIGKHFSMVVSLELRREASLLHDQFIENGTEIPDYWKVIRKDGSEIDIFVCADLLIYENGEKLKVTSIRDVTEELKNERQRQQLEKELTRAVIKGEEKERKSIGLELHDNISQLLSASKMFLGSYLKNRKEQNLTEALDLITESVKEIRNLSHKVALPKIADDGLVNSINILIHQINETSTIYFTLNHNLNEADLNIDLKINLYRVIQEQINNVIKHSKASKCIIDLYQENSEIYLNISDNGIGFDITKLTSGIGLKNIETRVNLFDGNMEIIASEGNGCILKIVFNMNTFALN